MKHIIKLIFSTLLIMVMAAGCDTEELQDMNLNPNAVKEMDMNLFFTAACLGAASNGSSGDNRYTDWRTNINFASFAIQHFASTGATAGEKYFDNDMEPQNAPFQFYYRDALKRTHEILVQTGPGGYLEGKMKNTREASRIIRVFNFHRLTDFYGSVPYTEANKGLPMDGGILQPKYDKQKDIYTDMLNELDEACAAISTANSDDGFKKADIIFNGDVAKWKKWGYSLMLRLAMRLSDVDATMAATYVTKAVAGGTMTSNADNVWVKMSLSPSEWMNQNGISRAFYPGDGGAWQGQLLSKTLIDQLKGPNKASTVDDDPRLTIFTQGAIKWTAGDLGTPIISDPLLFEGMPSGVDGSWLNNFYGKTVIPYELFCAVNTKMMQDDEPYQLMNAAESEFLKAEAIVKSIGSVTGTAQAHYEEGVKLAMQLYTVYAANAEQLPNFTVTDAQVNQYLAQHPYDAGNAIEQIYTQLWLSKFMMWWDAWADWRKSGYPVLVASNYPGNATGGTIPVKLQIPAAEAAGNPNYSTTATMPDKMTTKVWWDGGAE